jgi:hypothetical protein
MFLMSCDEVRQMHFVSEHPSQIFKHFVKVTPVGTKWGRRRNVLDELR